MYPMWLTYGTGTIRLEQNKSETSKYAGVTAHSHYNSKLLRLSRYPELPDSFIFCLKPVAMSDLTYGIWTGR